GYIEETGAAQMLRDARVLPIYEGTNGIQAYDLVFRRLIRNRGETVKRHLAAMDAQLARLQQTALPQRDAIVQRFALALESLEEATSKLLWEGFGGPMAAAAVATPYLRLLGTVLAGSLLLRGAMAAAQATGEHRY